MPGHPLNSDDGSDGWSGRTNKRYSSQKSVLLAKTGLASQLWHNRLPLSLEGQRFTLKPNSRLALLPRARVCGPFSGFPLEIALLGLKRFKELAVFGPSTLFQSDH